MLILYSTVFHLNKNKLIFIIFVVVHDLTCQQLADLLRKEKFREQTVMLIEDRNINGNALELMEDEVLSEVACDRVDKSKLKELIKRNK